MLLEERLERATKTIVHKKISEQDGGGGGGEWSAEILFRKAIAPFDREEWYHWQELPQVVLSWQTGVGGGGRDLICQEFCGYSIYH